MTYTTKIWLVSRKSVPSLITFGFLYRVSSVRRDSLEGIIINYEIFNRSPNSCGEHLNDTILKGLIYSKPLSLRG